MKKKIKDVRVKSKEKTIIEKPEYSSKPKQLSDNKISDDKIVYIVIGIFILLFLILILDYIYQINGLDRSLLTEIIENLSKLLAVTLYILFGGKIIK